MILAMFAGSSNLVSPKATTTAIGPAYIFFALCGVAMIVIYFFGMETRNKTITEIETMLEKGKAATAASTT
jgi:putative MFS transporter